MTNFSPAWKKDRVEKVKETLALSSSLRPASYDADLVQETRRGYPVPFEVVRPRDAISFRLRHVYVV